MSTFIGTREAAERLNISVRRVQSLISAGRLPAEKIGKNYAIKAEDLTRLNGRKNGRTRKPRERTQAEWNKILRKYIGCINDGPKDLSTNPKYMEGYGR